MDAQVDGAFRNLEAAAVQLGVDRASGIQDASEEAVRRYRGELSLAFQQNQTGRIASALERIAAALERANDLDPIAAIEKALQEPPTAPNDEDVRDDPTQAWRFR